MSPMGRLDSPLLESLRRVLSGRERPGGGRSGPPGRGDQPTSGFRYESAGHDRANRRRVGRLKTGIILVVIGFFLPLWPLPWVAEYDYRYLGLVGSVLRHPGSSDGGSFFLPRACASFSSRRRRPRSLRGSRSFATRPSISISGSRTAWGRGRSATSEGIIPVCSVKSAKRREPPQGGARALVAVPHVSAAPAPQVPGPATAPRARASWYAFRRHSGTSATRTGSFFGSGPRSVGARAPQSTRISWEPGNTGARNVISAERQQARRPRGAPRMAVMLATHEGLEPGATSES